MNVNFNLKDIDFQKLGGLVPAIIQDAETRKVLMLGFMNEAALVKSLTEGVATFYSRSKNRLWTKGETSGHFLNIVSVQLDCDADTLLFHVNPVGPVCHTGTDTCWREANPKPTVHYLTHLENVIKTRKRELTEGVATSSYTASLMQKGINKVAQKVGEEAVELVIEAKDDNRDLFLGEAADLLYHYLVLLAAKDFALNNVIEVLKKRHR